MNFSRNVIFGVPGQNISRTTGSNCMIFSEVIYINKMCVLNQLDFHLKAESFFKLQRQKDLSFFIAEEWPCTAWLGKIDQKNHFIQNTLQLPLDTLAQKSET